MIFFNNNASANYEKLFYDFKINDISGKELDLNTFRNKVVLLVNTSSYCGFTKQYTDLQFIWHKNDIRSRSIFCQYVFSVLIKSTNL